SDEALMQRFTPEQWRNLAPHVAQQRQRGYVLWHHADGEVSMAQPLDKHAAALAFAGMWRIDEAEAAARLQALKALNQRIAQ
ncbi:TPA: IclR family transcriptional regulator, partial [Salmonella enterica]|nr:IclR family transcriptional regulator [Salmonella enterica]